jgi:chemotaxis signal transduction protein
MVLRLGCCKRRGTSRVASSRKVKLPGVAALRKSVLLVVDLGVVGNLGQIAAHQGEMMLVVDLADRPDALHALLVADHAAEGIGRVGRIGHDPAACAIS